MKYIVTIIFILLSPILGANEMNVERLTGIWEAESSEAAGIYFYDKLVFHKGLSGVYFSGGVGDDPDNLMGGTFSRNNVIDKDGYYEIRFPSNKRIKLVVAYDISLNVLRGWLFITDPVSGFTFSPFVKQFYKTNGEDRGAAISNVNNRVNKALNSQALPAGTPKVGAH